MLKLRTWVSQGPKVLTVTSGKAAIFSIHLSSLSPSMICNSPVWSPSSRELTAAIYRTTTCFRDRRSPEIFGVSR